MTDYMRRELPLRQQLNRVVRSACVAIFAILSAVPASAQGAPGHLQGPDLGTWVRGVVDIQLRASGGSGPGTYTWSLVAGALPPGLLVRTDVPSHYPANANAGLLGVATTPGLYQFTLRVTSGGQSTDRAYTLRIAGLTIADPSLPEAFQGQAYAFQYAPIHNAGPVTFSPNGALPGGLGLSPTGLLSGTPTGTGFFNVNISITDGVETSFHGRSLSIFAINITSPGALPYATFGVPYNETLTASGGTPPYTFTECPGNTVGENCVPGVSGLPSGLLMDGAGNITGTVNSGVGKFSFTVTVTDANNVSYSKLMSITVVGQPPTLPSIGLYGNIIDDCMIGSTCSQGLSVSSGGRPPFTWSAIGLPPGMSIRTGSRIASQYITPGDGEIVGAPTALGDYDVQVTVTDADGVSATNTFRLHVTPMWLRQRLASGTIGVPYSSTLRVYGGRPPYSAVLKAGRLPAGLVFDPNTFTVSGTPTENGQFNFSFDPLFLFTDADGKTLEQHSYFDISAGASTIAVNTGSNLGARTLNAFFTQTFSACCVPSLTWSHVGGTLPTGTSLASNGVLSGTPTVEGTFTFLLQAADATNPGNVAIRQFTLTVSSIVTSAPFTLPIANVGAPYSVPIGASGGTGALTYAFTPRTYPPPGMTIDSITGVLSGPMTASGQFFFSVDISDQAGRMITRGFGIAVYPAGVTPPLNLNIGPVFGPRGIGVFTTQLNTTGGTPPYSYSMTPGAPAIPGMRVQDGQPLPTGFNVPAGFIGVLTLPGTYNTSIRVTDSTGTHFDRAITVIVTSIHHLSQTTLPRVAVGVPYSFQFSADGGSGNYSWALSSTSQVLPAGLALSPAGLLSGTPTSPTVASFNVTLTDLVSQETLTVAYSLTVDPFAITTARVLPVGMVGTPYTQTLAAPGCGFPCTWTSSAANIVGLTLAADGTLSGTPTGTFNGSFTATATGPNGTAQRIFGLQVLNNTPQPLFITSTITTSVVVGNTTATSILASGGTPPYSWAVQNGALPTGITLYASGDLAGNLNPGTAVLAGRAMQTGVFNFTLEVTDAVGATATRAFAWTGSALSVQYTNLPVTGPLLNNPLVYNTPYVQPLLVIGGTGNYAWALSSALTSPMPPGLALNAGGIVSGTPSSTGTFSVLVAANDNGGNSNVTNVNFNVAGGTPVTLGFSSGPNLGVSQQGFSRSFNVSPTGGTPPYAVTALTPLPAGFALQSGDALLANSAGGIFFVTGVPLATGTQTFTLHAQDSAGNIGVRTFVVTFVPVTLFSNVLGDGSVGVPYSQALVIWNGAATNWAVFPGSALPQGLNVSPAGVISGTPTTAGNYSFTLSATDAAGVLTTFGFSLRISQIGITDPLVVPQTAVVGQPFTYTFTATGPAGAVWSVAAPPPGLAMSATGTLSGTPTDAGAFNILVTATDGVVQFTRRFTLFIELPNPAVLDSNIASTSLADAVVGQSVSFILNNTGGTPPYRWSVAAGSALPQGLQLIVAGTNLPNFPPGATLLAGAPTATGLYVFDLNLTDAAGTVARRTFRLNVSAITIVSGIPKTAVTGAAYAQRFLAVGGTPPYTFTMTPVNATDDMLPPGLTLAANGLLSGTPTSTGSYTFRLQVTDATGQTFARNTTLTVVSPSGLRVLNNNPDDVWVGAGWAITTLNVSGSSTYTWTKVGGTLPPGVGLVTNGTDTLLAGAPTTPGVYTFTLRATDTSNPANVADHTFTHRVVPMQMVSPAVSGVIFFGAPPLPHGQVGAPYSFTFKMAGGTPPYTFAASPFAPLPAGMTLNAAGVLSGTPQSVGTHRIDVDVTDAAGHRLAAPTLSFTITAAGAAPPLFVFSDTLPGGSVGAPYIWPLIERGLFTRGGTPPFTWSVAAGSALPPGLVLLAGGNGISNLIGGVPTTAGDYAFSLLVTDAGGQSAVGEFELPISSLALTPDSLTPGVVGALYSRALVPSGGAGPYTMQLLPESDMPPGLSLTPAGLLSGTPNAPGSFVLLITVADSAGNTHFVAYFLTIDNAAGQSPAISVAPRPIQVYYEIGSPAPAPVPINVATTSGSLLFNALVTGIPGATLSAAGGTTPATLNLNLNPAGLATGTYTGVVAVNANPFDAVPVTLTVALPPACSYTVNPTNGSVPASGGAGSFAVAAGPACAWTTTGPPPSLVQITAGANGTGPGNVGYTVAPNTSPNARNLVIRVQGQPHTIIQFGTACSFAISPSTLNVPAIGGNANITVTASDPSCPWAAVGLGAAPAAGTGSGIVTVTIPPNLNALTQQVTATIGGRTLTVNQSGAGCTVSLSPNDAAAPAGGGQGSVAVTVPAGCGYDTTSAPSWVSITAGGTGTSSGNLVYSVAPNSTTAERIGTLTIGGQPFQIKQAGLACSVTVDTSGLGSPFGPAGGAGVIGISTNGANCAWNAASNVPWASVNVPAGTGNGTIGVTLQSNAASTVPRFGALTIAGQLVNLQQDGTTCTFSLKSAAGAAPSTGGAGSVSVVAPSVCGWAAVSNNLPWLTITSSAAGGTGDVQFVAQANTASAPRVGTLTIAGLTYTLTQAGAPCAYTLSHTNTNVAAGGASDLFTFSTTASGCTPNAQSYAGWITANTAFDGTNGTVTFDVTPNPSTATRTGTIRLGEQNFTVRQVGGACGFSLNSNSSAFGPLGSANASVLGSPSAVGCVPVVGTDQPGFITLGNLAGPVLNIFTLPYAISPLNSLTPAVRLGNITFGGQILKVKQTSY